MMKKNTSLLRLFALMLLSGLNLTAHADDSPAPTNDNPPPSLGESTGRLVKSYVLGRNLQLGVGFAQENLTLSKPGDRSIMTDNGSAVLLASLSSKTSLLRHWDLRNGGSVGLGYDFSATGSFFGMKEELVNSAFAGSNVGTSVNGGFVAFEPRLSLSMGPLYSGSQIFWKYTLGAGPGLLHYSGTSAFFGNASSGTHSVSAGAAPVFYIENKWTTQVGHWDFILNAQYMTGHSQGYTAIYQVYGAGAAYEFGF